MRKEKKSFIKPSGCNDELSFKVCLHSELQGVKEKIPANLGLMGGFG